MPSCSKIDPLLGLFAADIGSGDAAMKTRSYGGRVSLYLSRRGLAKVGKFRAALEADGLSLSRWFLDEIQAAVDAYDEEIARTRIKETPDRNGSTNKRASKHDLPPNG